MTATWRGLPMRPFEFSYADEPVRAVRGRVVLPIDAPSGGRTRKGHPWVMVLHGFKGFMDWGFFPLLQERLARAGFAVVACNTSGSGVGPTLADIDDDEAFARDTVTRQLEDLERVRRLVLDTTLGEGLDPDRGGLFGHSRGGGVGILHAAAAGAYRAVVTWAAIDAVDRFDPDTKARWRRGGALAVPNGRLGRDHRLDLTALDDAEEHARKGDVPAACARLRCPTLLVHGAEDPTVPAVSAQNLLRASGASISRAVLLPKSDHVFGARHPLRVVPETLEAALAPTLAWFEEYMLQEPPAPGDPASKG